MNQYVGILMYLVFALCLSGIVLLAGFICGPRKWNPEKSSAYECGFDPFDDETKTKDLRFEVDFYLVAILFMIFDLEVAFLFPWACCLDSLLDTQATFSNLVSFWSMMIFLGILTIGFVYEWQKGALDWSGKVE